MSVIHTA